MKGHPASGKTGTEQSISRHSHVIRYFLKKGDCDVFGSRRDPVFSVSGVIFFTNVYRVFFTCFVPLVLVKYTESNNEMKETGLNWEGKGEERCHGLKGRKKFSFAPSWRAKDKHM